MRYAIFSDVHANERAWERVLADIREQQPDVLVCLGDVVGYGPKPEEVLRGIREVTGNILLGNHDAAAAGAMDYSAFNDHAKHSIEWTARALSVESREFLSGLPLAIEDGEILFVHAEITDPGCFGYIDDARSAKQNFAHSHHSVTFVGHTHHPNLYRLDGNGRVDELPDRDQLLDPSNRYIVNVGSVGEPRNPDDLRGVYVIFDSGTRELSFRRVPFDIEGYRHDLDSTALGFRPFFLQCYEHQVSESETAILEAARAHAMAAPAASTALANRSRRSVQLHFPDDLRGIRASLEQSPSTEKKWKTGAVVFWILSGLVLVGACLGSFPHHREGPFAESVVLQEDIVAILPRDDIETEPEAGTVSPGTGDPPKGMGPDPPDSAGQRGKKEVATLPHPAPKPKSTPPTAKPSGSEKPALGPKPDPHVAWWRMEEDSLGRELVDQTGGHSLAVQFSGSRIRALAPAVIPANGSANEFALELGAWSETEPGGVFRLGADRSFTCEGWLLTGKQRVPVFLAGTRSGDANQGQGWHIDLRPPGDANPDGQICFFFDHGPGIIQALSGNVEVSNLEPHHFAAVWDHDASPLAGQMRLYLDGVLVAEAEVPRSLVPPSQANPFRIGSLANPPRVGLDEVRFSRVALDPRQFLNITPEIILLEEDFEDPEVTGFDAKAIPARWVGSAAGFGSNRRGIVDQGKGAEFTTVAGRQAFLLHYANAGLTSRASAITETLAPGRTYRVNFSVAAKKGTTSDYLVELVAFDPEHDDHTRKDTTRAGRPGSVLARAEGIVKTHDFSHRDSIRFSVDSTSPHIGKAIGIRIARFGHNGAPLYDNLELTSRAGSPTLASSRSGSVRPRTLQE